jgi:hypothetical protein
MLVVKVEHALIDKVKIPCLVLNVKLLMLVELYVENACSVGLCDYQHSPCSGTCTW